jgi:hypothetical protein
MNLYTPHFCYKDISNYMTKYKFSLFYSILKALLSMGLTVKDIVQLG